MKTRTILLLCLLCSLCSCLSLLAAEQSAPAGGGNLAVIQLLPWALGVLGGIFGLWRNKKLSTTRKVLESVVIGVEAAGRMPSLAGNDRTVKRQIQIRAVAAGVEPLLREVVRQVAEPTVQEEIVAQIEATAAAGADRP